MNIESRKNVNNVNVKVMTRSLYFLHFSDISVVQKSFFTNEYIPIVFLFRRSHYRQNSITGSYLIMPSYNNRKPTL